jgi:hypothetical protein
MRVSQNGFIYNEQKEVIAEFNIGNEVFTNENIFYGTKEQAIEFGLIFKEQ